MTAQQLALIFTVPLLLACSACCSASETALFGLTDSDRLRLRKEHPRTAAAAAALLARPRRVLITILFLNTLVNTGVFAVGSVLSVSLARAAGAWGDPDGMALAAGIRAGVELGGGIAGVLTVLLVGEVVPKTIAVGQRLRVARCLLPALRAADALLAPLCGALDTAVLAPLARLVRPGAGAAGGAVTPDELASMLALGATSGVIDADEQRILGEVVQLGATRIREVMTPRVDIHWIDADADAEELFALIRRTGHTKFPVCEGVPERGVAGFLNTKRLLAALGRGGAPLRVRDHMDPALFVPDRARLDQLLDHFRRTRSHVAICVDEHGEITGLVEVEDAVRGLTAAGGDPGRPGQEQVRALGHGRWEVPGRLSVRDWSQFFGRGERGIDRRVSTVAGLVLSRLGRLPRAGESVRIGNVRLTVDAMDGLSIERVGVSLEEAPSEGPAA